MAHLPIWCTTQIDPGLCDRVIAELSNKQTTDAVIGIDGAENNNAVRRTKVHFADAGYWLEDVFAKFAMQSNSDCKWEYHITGAEKIQFAEYGVGHHYTWHTDTFTLAGRETDRKITVVCLLNDGFEGGDFEVRLYGDYNAQLKKGTVIAFPSILEHRVTPILSGTRYSATMWFNGPRFR